MVSRIILITLALASVCLADNVTVVNKDNQPVPVKGTFTATVNPATLATSAKQDDLFNIFNKSIGLPGATPSPSPRGAVSVQGYTNGIPVPVTAAQKQLTGVPDSFVIRSADATVFTLTAGQIGFIQNLSADAPLAVKYGASASSSSFNFILAPGTATSDGKGGAVWITNWTGVISVAKMTGTASYVAWTISP